MRHSHAAVPQRRPLRRAEVDAQGGPQQQEHGLVHRLRRPKHARGQLDVQQELGPRQPELVAKAIQKLEVRCARRSRSRGCCWGQVLMYGYSECTGSWGPSRLLVSLTGAHFNWQSPSCFAYNMHPPFAPTKLAVSSDV